jgi:hypothetical protein
MALTWTLDQIKDYEEVCWIEDRLNPVTEALIWATMAVGIPQITDDNADEFYDRLHRWERLVAYYVIEGGKGPRPITREEVKAHIGLHTNASRLTRAQFGKKLMEVPV